MLQSFVLYEETRFKKRTFKSPDLGSAKPGDDPRRRRAHRGLLFRTEPRKPRRKRNEPGRLQRPPAKPRGRGRGGRRAGGQDPQANGPQDGPDRGTTPYPTWPAPTPTPWVPTPPSTSTAPAFPGQEEANVYVAGHRLGYPNSDSFLAFFDLNKLENGDQAFVTDAAGTQYTYEVFSKSVVGPTDLSVTEPIPGKNVLTLQTCTLPDYSDRLIVQAELVEVA